MLNCARLITGSTGTKDLFKHDYVLSISSCLLQVWDNVVQLPGQPSRYGGQGDSNLSLELGWLPIRE